MTPRTLLRSLVPPAAIHLLRWRRDAGLRFSGRHGSWVEAQAASSGYDDPAILRRVVAATREVVAGRAAYERDSVLFQAHSLPPAVVAGILRSAVLDDGIVAVVDVGGSLGSSFRQCRAFLEPLHRLEWYVVEQPKFVEAGQEFATPELSFHLSVEEVPATAVPATFLLSSVLQYLEHPSDLLHALAARPSRHLILDRTPVSADSEDRLCVQHAPRAVYEATYPMWIFSRSRLGEVLDPHWQMVCDEPGADGAHTTSDGLELEFRTMIFERRT